MPNIFEMKLYKKENFYKMKKSKNVKKKTLKILLKLVATCYPSFTLTYYLLSSNTTTAFVLN